MTEQHSTLRLPIIEITFAAIEDEEDDLETISLIEDTRLHVQTALADEPGYVLQGGSDGTRGDDILLVLWEVVKQVASNAETIVTLVQSSITVLQAVQAQKQVTKIELKLGDDMISIEKPDAATKQQLMDIFAARHGNSTLTSGANAPLQITATVSRKAQGKKKSKGQRH